MKAPREVLSWRARNALARLEAGHEYDAAPAEKVPLAVHELVMTGWATTAPSKKSPYTAVSYVLNMEDGP